MKWTFITCKNSFVLFNLKMSNKNIYFTKELQVTPFKSQYNNEKWWWDNIPQLKKHIPVLDLIWRYKFPGYFSMQLTRKNVHNRHNFDIIYWKYYQKRALFKYFNSCHIDTQHVIQFSSSKTFSITLDKSYRYNNEMLILHWWTLFTLMTGIRITPMWKGLTMAVRNKEAKLRIFKNHPPVPEYVCFFFFLPKRRMHFF